MSKKLKSEALESVHESASALLAVGAISKTTMRQFDAACLAPVPAQISPQQIQQLRERNNVSQPVFARYLNTSASTVRKWEVGDKRPSGPSQRLLDVIERKGLEAVL